MSRSPNCIWRGLLPWEFTTPKVLGVVGSSQDLSVRLRRRIREHRVVEHVGKDILELEADPLHDTNILDQPHVNVPVGQAAEHANSAGVRVETQNCRTSVA